MALLFFIISWAQALSPIKEIPCFDSVTKVLDVVETQATWMRFPGGVALRLKDQGSVEVYPEAGLTHLVLTTPQTRTGFTFRAPGCKSQVEFSEASKKVFSDIDLAELFNRHKSGLIYIWSPHMELSLQEIKQLQKYHLDYPYTVLMDLEAEPILVAKIQQTSKLAAENFLRVSSRALSQADIGIHYPVTVFYKDGAILKRIPGYHGMRLKEMARRELK